MWLAEVKAKAKCKNQILFSKDCLLLDELCQLIEQANRRVLVLWALELAEESARVLAEKYPEDHRPREAIGGSISPSASEYIAAKEQKICAELIYVAWLGFQQNLECFKNPVNTIFLKMDYEDFHRERLMHTLPKVQKAAKTINAFHEIMRALPEEKQNLTAGISEFMCYLETTGYKLAHYYGFILADEFLPHVIPGYCSDTCATRFYKRDLCKYLQLNLELLH